MGAYVDLLNGLREKDGKELSGWEKDAAHCLMRAISTAKGKVKLWYDALDDLVAFFDVFPLNQFQTNVRVVTQRW